ncbi:MAG: phosphodiester glycosidase family protein [Chthonomonas sp.]|nr:phosphodiester glycosidase family protein [Chthonomonas sp.]
MIFAPALWQPSPINIIQDRKNKVDTVVVNLNDQRASFGVVTAKDFPGTDESFASMVGRSNAAVAINGAYFSTTTLLPIGDLFVDGQLLHGGRMGTVLKMTEDGKMDIERVVRHRTMDWRGHKFVLGCGPALVLDGKVDVDWRGEGFRDPHVTGKTARMAIGYTQGGKLLLVRIGRAVSFGEEAEIMRKLGCHEAMNLDAGASSGLYANGKILVKPSRELTSILAAWVSQ